MWYFISWADHIPPVDIPLQVPLQPFLEASVCMRTCTGGWINDQPLQKSRCVIHHSGSVFDWWFRTIFWWYEWLSFIDYVCWGWRYRHCNLAGNTAWIVDVNKPIAVVNSAIDGASSVSKFWHFVFTFCIFSSVRDISRLTELIFSPKNSILCTDFKTDFFQWITKPRCCNIYCVKTYAYLFYGVAH